MRKSSLIAVLTAWAVAGGTEATQADVPKLEVVRQAPVQGGFLLAKLPAGSTATLDGRPLWVGQGGELVVGFDRGDGFKILKTCLNEACSERRLAVLKRVFKTQNVKGIPPQTVEPSAEEQKRIEADAQATQAARNTAVAEADRSEAFMEPFRLPVDGPTSGVYGSRRTYNGQERSWHKGHDLAAKTGTPVVAPASGTVRLARDTFMSGNLIMLDHGGGVTTVYAHLDSMAVAAGDKVAAGDMIGKVGTTGRSSGPHLHWGAYWRNVAIDPILWVVK